jgi:predicted GNAT family acetyltransferase
MCFGTGAGLLGLGFSWYAMRSGHAHMLLSGSVDEILPFDKNGRPPGNNDVQVDHVPGEGACMFMLETLSHAKRRNAAIVGEVCSFAYATETIAEISPGASAPLIEKVVTQALKEAKISSEDIFAVCSTLKDYPPKKALDLTLGRSDYKTYDVSRFLGNAPATMSSFNVAYALLDSSIEKSESKKYILTVLNSSAGAYCAAIFAK